MFVCCLLNYLANHGRECVTWLVTCVSHRDEHVNFPPESKFVTSSWSGCRERLLTEGGNRLEILVNLPVGGGKNNVFDLPSLQNVTSKHTRLVRLPHLLYRRRIYGNINGTQGPVVMFLSCTALPLKLQQSHLFKRHIDHGQKYCCVTFVSAIDTLQRLRPPVRDESSLHNTR